MSSNIFLKYSFISLLIILFNLCKLQALENKILFKIDNQIITTVDIYHEVNFLKIFNPQINNLNNEEQLVISKNSIIRDKIKKTEILNFVEEIKVEDKYLINLIKNKYSEINVDTIKSFENYLVENNLNVDLIKEKFAIELIWNDLVYQKYNSKILIDKEKIKSEILKKPKKNQAFILIKKRKENLKNYFYLTKKNNLNEAAKNLYSCLRKIKNSG